MASVLARLHVLGGLGSARCRPGFARHARRAPPAPPARTGIAADPRSPAAARDERSAVPSRSTNPASITSSRAPLSREQVLDLRPHRRGVDRHRPPRRSSRSRGTSRELDAVAAHQRDAVAARHAGCGARRRRARRARRPHRDATTVAPAIASSGRSPNALGLHARSIAGSVRSTAKRRRGVSHHRCRPPR